MPNMDAENWFRMDYSTSQLSSPTLASLLTGGAPLAPTSDGLAKVVDTTFLTVFKVVLAKLVLEAKPNASDGISLSDLALIPSGIFSGEHFTPTTRASGDDSRFLTPSPLLDLSDAS